MQTQLFRGSLSRLAAFDPDQDAPIESAWTHDPDYAHVFRSQPMVPRSALQVRKQREEWAREGGRDRFDFMIRTLDGDRLIGMAALYWIEWTHGVGHLRCAIGAPADRGRGFGTDALRMLLRYCFDEMNLHKVGAYVAGYNARAIAWLMRSGFVEEERRREAVFRHGQRYDDVQLALLASAYRGRGNV